MDRGPRSPPRIDGMVSLKVDNLAYKTTVEDLHRIFGRYGDVGESSLMLIVIFQGTSIFLVIRTLVRAVVSPSFATAPIVKQTTPYVVWTDGE